jgi:RsiW-degrading membrane proteinase PrsW (M82 family)
MNIDTIIYALLGGILPALVWLMFWLREDKKNPEPKRLIARTFFFGMLSVLAVLPFQKWVESEYGHNMLIALFLWATVEELFKLIAAYFGGLRSKEDNEAIDPIIYMITAALGFVALENTLFIMGPLLGEDLPRTIITGNLRFMGASLLHVITSGLIGVALAFTFYKRRWAKVPFVASGLVVAIIAHTTFNVLILKWGQSGTILSFVSVWIGVVLLLLTFERTKALRS